MICVGTSDGTDHSTHRNDVGKKHRVVYNAHCCPKELIQKSTLLF